MIKESPILFSGEMVRAIRDGRKSQTRRVVKLPRKKGLEYRWDGAYKDGGPNSLFKAGEYLHIPFRSLGDDWSHGTTFREFCPHGQPGDHLIVKETFLYRAQKQAVIYRADLDPAEAAGVGAMYGGWKPSIFMPLKFSRITLEIVSVRVERVQEIHRRDAQAEGITCRHCKGYSDNQHGCVLRRRLRSTLGLHQRQEASLEQEALGVGN